MIAIRFAILRSFFPVGPFLGRDEGVEFVGLFGADRFLGQLSPLLFRFARDLHTATVRNCLLDRGRVLSVRQLF
jgi:hypothetical protein